MQGRRSENRRQLLLESSRGQLRWSLQAVILLLVLPCPAPKRLEKHRAGDCVLELLAGFAQFPGDDSPFPPHHGDRTVWLLEEIFRGLSLLCLSRMEASTASPPVLSSTGQKKHEIMWSLLGLSSVLLSKSSFLPGWE